MPKMIWDESYWLQRAEEARTISADLRSPECRQIMREMAASYERLAQLTKDFRRGGHLAGPDAASPGRRS